MFSLLVKIPCQSKLNSRYILSYIVRRRGGCYNNQTGFRLLVPVTKPSAYSKLAVRREEVEKLFRNLLCLPGPGLACSLSKTFILKNESSLFQSPDYIINEHLLGRSHLSNSRKTPK